MVQRTDSEQARADQAQKRFREGVEARRRAIEDAKPKIHSDPAIERDPNFPLKVFEGQCDWIVARDLEDAAAVLAEHYGQPYNEVVGEDTVAEAMEEFAVADPEKPLTLHQEDWRYRTPERGRFYASQWPVIFGNYSDEPDDTGLFVCWTVQETAPMWWWAQHFGRGFLGSTEW